MPTPRPERTGYTVTLEVFVPAERADLMVEKLDHRWHNESWTPEAAAYELAKESLEAAGLHRSRNLGTSEVLA
jgi:hypothetical protein